MAEFRINDGVPGSKTVEAHHFEEKDSLVIFFSTDASRLAGQVYAMPVSQVISIERVESTA
ncbi:hypothetical protein ACFWU5_23095 [Nocardia sp. NPDC058640]|uniref:hypothetical protein n=1 Tax=Nocardia sp. NPDC058640 TaxID=3346571 RepID=UPI00364AFD1F